MKGLLIKDFYTMKSEIKGTIISSIFCFIFVLVLKLASEYGNLKDSFEITDIDIFVKIIAAGVAVFSIFFVSSLIDKDKKSQLSKTMRSTKISRKQLISSRYITLFALAGMGLIISVAFQILCHITGIMDFDIETVGLVFVVQLVCIMISSVSIGAGLISGNKNVAYGVTMGFCFILVIAINLIGYIKTQKRDIIMSYILMTEKTTTELIYTVIISLSLFSLLIIFLSYLLSLKFGRDEY